MGLMVFIPCAQGHNTFGRVRASLRCGRSLCEMGNDGRLNARLWPAPVSGGGQRKGRVRGEGAGTKENGNDEAGRYTRLPSLLFEAIGVRPLEHVVELVFELAKGSNILFVSPLLLPWSDRFLMTFHFPCLLQL